MQSKKKKFPRRPELNFFLFRRLSESHQRKSRLLQIARTMMLCGFLAASTSAADESAKTQNTAPRLTLEIRRPQNLSALPTITLQINGGNIETEVAATAAARKRGLSHRPSLKKNSGMLLMFESPRWFCLWMLDVAFPLDALFIGDSGEITEVANMSPHDESLHCAEAKYALEISPALRRRLQIKIGDSIANLPAAVRF